MILILPLLLVNTICQVTTEQSSLCGGKTVLLGRSEEAEAELENTFKGRGMMDDEKLAPKFDGLSGLSGLTGVWWPGSHVISSWWSLLAAGLSSVAIGTAVLPGIRRSDSVEERVFRGVEAEPYSWPWIAKLKVGHKQIEIQIYLFSMPDHLPETRSKSTKESLRGSPDCRQVQHLRYLSSE